MPGQSPGTRCRSGQALGDHAPWPLTHLGRQSLATLTRAANTELRLVLRIWGSAFEIQNAGGTAPLLLLSLTIDWQDLIDYGYSQLEQMPLPDQLSGEGAALQTALRNLETAQASKLPTGADGPVLLVR